MIRQLLVMTVMSAGLAAACESDASPETELSASPTITPEARASASPTSTPEADTAVVSADIVFLRDDDLWTARIDGSEERRITSGSHGAGYAGVATDPEGTRWIYYTDMTSRDSDRREAEFVVGRFSAGTGENQQLLTFSGDAKHIQYSRANASVSRDGRYVAYSSPEGIMVRDVATGATNPVLTNSRDACVNGPLRECWGFYLPRWSPTGDMLTATQIFYEGGGGVLVTMHEGQPASELTLPGEAVAWSADGEHVCALLPRFRYGFTEGVAVVTTSGAAGPNVVATGLPIAGYMGVGECRWSQDGRLAFVVHTCAPGCPETERFLAISDAETIIARLDLGGAEGGRRVVDWLPDGTGVVVSKRVWPDSWRNTVVSLDGTITPFALPDVELLAVVP